MRSDDEYKYSSLHSISAMRCFKNKSFEELRLEDYLPGNRGQGQTLQSTNEFPSEAITAATSTSDKKIPLMTVYAMRNKRVVA